MTTIKRPGFFQPHTLALAVALGVSASAANAVNFNLGPVEGQLDSALSVGASWSTAKPDSRLVGTTNGGTGYSQTGDDYRLNFKRGETFSKIFKGSHDLELKYGDTGVFVRGKYWYDFELKDESRLFKDISDSNRKTAAQASGAEILDAFVYHNYSIGDLPGSVRVGRQVVSWGESTFIGNSINSINPIDAAAFRRPGAEVKEGLIPVNMIYLSQSLTDRLSAEAFYQLEWDQTVADNCGTFFATADVVADGCANNYHFLNSQQVPGLLAAQQAGLPSLANIQIDNEGVVLPRGQDRDARDSGQFGLALRWAGDAAEYGAYFINYHSRTPTVNFQYASAANLGAAFAAPAAVRQAVLIANGNYFLDYPEDIQLYGLSFSTSLPTGTAWQGEISYRPNAPIQINGTGLTAQLAADPGYLAAIGDVAGALALGGQDIKGYRRKEITQVQTTFTHFFDQVMGAGRLTLVGEIGAMRIGGLESQYDIAYGRDSIYGFPNCPVTGCSVGFFSNTQAAERNGYHGFYTASSWGYRARAIWDYSNVFAGVNLSPSISWSHDVDGYGPVFNEGSKAISVGVDASYRNTYNASLSYTDFFGGRYNVLKDRDFLALSVGVNF
jgi:hypothetical protein